MSKTISGIISSNNNSDVRPSGISIISTPNGVGNWYHRMWLGAISGDNMYTPIKFHWSEIPDYDAKWYE